MPYTIKLPDGSEVRDIPDDVDPQEAAIRIGQRFGDQEWATTLKGNVKALPSTMAKGIASVGQMLTESGLDNQEETIESIRRVNPNHPSVVEYDQARAKASLLSETAKQAELGVMKELPGKQSIGQQAFTSAVQSAPSLAAGLAVGTLNPALGMAVGGGLGGAQQAGETYREASSRGESSGDAGRHAMTQGIIEGLFDRFGISAGVKFGGTLAQRAGRTALAEGSSELATEGAHIAYERGTYRPDMTADEAVNRLIVATLAGGGSGAVFGGAIHPAVKARENYVAQALLRAAGQNPTPEEGQVEVPGTEDVTVTVPEQQPVSEPEYVSRKVSALTPQGLQWNEETGKLEISDRPDIGYQELPIDVRLSALSALDAQVQHLKEQVPGFNATAEEKIQQRGRVQVAEQQRDEIWGQLVQEYTNNPESRSAIYMWGTQHGLSLPEVDTGIVVDKGMKVRSPEEVAQIEGLTAEVSEELPTLEAETRSFYQMGLTDDKITVRPSAAITAKTQKLIEGQTAMFSGDLDGSSYIDWKLKAPPDSAAFFTNDTLPAQDVEFAADLLSYAKEVVNTVLPGKRVVLYTEGSLIGSRTNSQVTIDGDTLAILLPRTGRSEQAMRIKSPEAYFTYLLTTSHEIGHGIMGLELAKASPEVQQVLWNEWANLLRLGTMKSPVVDGLVTAPKDVMEHFPGLTPKDIVFNTKSGRFEVKFDVIAKELYAPSRYQDNHALVEKPISEVIRIEGKKGDGWLQYSLSFDEYLAEQTAKYFLTRGGVVKGSEGFFKSVIYKLAQVYQNFLAKAKGYNVSPMPNFAQWMDGLVQSRAKFNVKEAVDIEGYKEALRKAGAPQQLIDAMVTIGDKGFQVDMMKNLREKLMRTPEQLREDERIKLDVLDKIITRVETFKQVTLSNRKTLAASLKKNLPTEYGELVDQLLALPEFNKGPIDTALMVQTLYKWLTPYTVRETRSTSKDGTLVDMQVLKKASRTLVYRSSYILSHDNAILMTAEGSQAEPLKMMQLAVELKLASRGVVKVKHLDEQEFHPLSDYALAEPPTQMMSMSLASGIKAVGKRLNVVNGPLAQLPQDLVRFNTILDKFTGAFQLAKLNLHIPGVKEIRTALRHKMEYKTQWLRLADEVVEEWAYGIPKAEQEKLARVLFDEAHAADAAQSPQQLQAAWMSSRQPDPNNPSQYIFIPTQAAQAKYGLDTRTWELYSKIRNSYSMALDMMERVGMAEYGRIYFSDPAVKLSMEEAIRLESSPADMRLVLEAFAQSSPDPTLLVRLQKDLDELQKQFQAQRDKPYTPYTRFGQYAVKVYEKGSGKLIHFETFESKYEMAEGFGELKGVYPNDEVKTTYVEDLPYMLQGMPPALLEAVQKRLNLTTQQIAQYQEMLKDLTHAQSFIKKTKKRKGMAGYSEDVVRGYADYFRRFANYNSRIRYASEMKDSLDMLEQFAKQQPNEVNARRLHEWFTDLDQYLREPGNELSEVKSFVATWHFAGNIGAAALNATQVGFVTLPMMAERFGWGQATKALKQAYADVAKGWKNQNVFSAEEQAMIDLGLDSGFLNQSFATTLAQTADGSALTRVSPVHRGQRAFSKFAHYMMLPFSKVEEMNRRVTMLAMYRLSRKGVNMHQGVDQDAFDEARSMVENSQNEYSIENRPKFMRGNALLIFQFMHYSQNMVFQMFGGDEAWKKLLVTQLFIAGIMGMPFAEDIKNFVKFISRTFFGKDVDVEHWAREYTQEYFGNADLILHGLSSDVFGWDLSNRLTFGALVPGMKDLGSHKKFDDAVYAAAGDMGGAGASLLLGALRGVADDDPDTLRRWEGVAPSALRYMIQAARAAEVGGVTDRSGAMLAETDKWDLVGLSIGYKPEQAMNAYRARTYEQEVGLYWTQRRQALLTIYEKATRDWDTDTIDRVKDRIDLFNDEVPDPALRIRGSTLRESRENRAESRQMKEAGMGANPQLRHFSLENKKLFD